MAEASKPVHQTDQRPVRRARFAGLRKIAVAYLVKRRWPEGVHCPRCGNAKVYAPVKTMAFKWQCDRVRPDIGYRFSHIAGTIFREHEQAAARLVQGHSLDAHQQKGH